MSEIEPNKLKIETLLKMMKQEMENPKIGKSEEAKFWFQIFALGIKNHHWKKEDTWEHVSEILKKWKKDINKSFNEQLDYVV